MSQLAPDDRAIYSRYQELGALAGVLFDLHPEELVFFRIDADGTPGRQGTPAVLVVKDTQVRLLRRADEVYAQVPEPGPTRVYWYTPAELEKPSTRDFVALVRQVGEAIVPLPPADESPGGPSCGGDCQACG